MPVWFNLSEYFFTNFSYKVVHIVWTRFILVYYLIYILKGDEDNTIFSKASFNLTEAVQQEVETESRDCRKLLCEGDDHLKAAARNEEQPNVKDKLSI